MFIWYAAGSLAAIAVAWLAALLHIAGRAPVGIVSIGVGLFLGAVLGGIAASQRLAGRQRLLAGTILLAFLAVLAQHAWLYRDFRRQWHEARANSAEAALFRPEQPWSPREYLAYELTPQRATLWCLDAALITAAAAGTVWALNRHPQQYARPSDTNPPTPDTRHPTPSP
jgi:hypothetical protein